MAKCLAESLIHNNGNFNGKDIRQRYILWWFYGYCNGIKGKKSMGLGGNIKDSLADFL